MIKSSIIAWLSVLTTSLAIALDLPAQTNSALVNKHNTRGWTPKPTAKPKPRFDLLRREETAFFNYEAPDQTCGFISGDASLPFACPSGFTCAIAFSTASDGGVLCCERDSLDCSFFDGCVDYYGYDPDSTCVDACSTDSNTLTCTDHDRPWCRMYSLEALNARAFQCDSISDIQTLSVAASDMYPLRWSSVNVIYNNPTDTMTLTTTPEDTPSTAISSLSSTSSVIQVQPSVVVLDLPSSQAAPVAAIVGGVIGGLAVIVITIAGITYMCLHHRRTMGDQSDASGTNAAIKPLSSMGQLPPYGIMVDKTGIEGPNSRERAISELGQ